MPKSAKKRRDRAADFSKAKLQLGKGKQLANNVIDTSFKARSIALPTQSIAVEKDEGAPTTKRRLTFDDLIGHVRHYSAGIRRDAIMGLRELLEANPQLIDPSLTTLINACVRIIGDEDASVRKTLLSFLSWLLPRIPTENLIPHSPLLILFTTSAQTHIFPEIRIDAIRFLDLFFEVIPETLVSCWTEGSGHGNRVLEGYLGILNAGTKFSEINGPIQVTSTASVVLSPASKLIALKSLSTFLTNALTLPNRTSTHFAENPSEILLPTWYLASAFASQEAYEAFDKLPRPHLQSTWPSSSSRIWQPETETEMGDDDFAQKFDFAAAASGDQWSLQELSEVVSQFGTFADGDTSRSTDANFVAHLARTLHSTLISTFLDCAPAIFSPTSNPPETELHLIMALAEITRSLYGAIFQDPLSGQHELAREDLRILLGYMTTYFPFRPITFTNRDIKVEQSFQDLNLIYCELTSLLVLASYTSSTNNSRASRGKSRQTAIVAQASEGVLSLQAERVSEYVIQLLRGEVQSGSQVGRPLNPTAYTALLPTIWSLLNQLSSTGHRISSSVLQATLDHATKTPSNSAVKKLGIEFVARLVLLETELQYQGSFRMARTADEAKKFEDWLVHLPKVLWELGSNSLSTTEVILRFQLRLFQRKSPLIHQETITSVRSRLVPYFTITHPSRGQLPGPYTRLPVSSPLRRLALDVIATISMISPGEKQDDGLEAAVAIATTNTEEADYWTHLNSVFG